MAPKRKRLADNARGDPAPKLLKTNDRLQEVAQVLMRLDVPAQRLVKSMCGSRNRNKMRDFDADLTAFSKMVTPYGTVATTIELPAVNGDTITLHCNNPFAFLWAASSLNNEFGNFIHGHLTANNGKGRVVVYIDETTPGNALRPDNGRKFEALLFSFAELPHWYLNRMHGFFKFAFIQTVDVIKVVGGLPAIVKAMMYKFFSPADFNFAASGVELQTPGGLKKHLRADFGFFILDEAASKSVFGVKGASGAKCCLRCMNVLGSKSQPPPGDNYLVRYSEHQRERWRGHTPHSYDSLIRKLDETARDDPGKLEELELMSGLVRQVNGVLWDPYLRKMIKMPHAMYWDTMHCKWASGGVVQYMLNTFALELGTRGITLAELDAFTNQCKGHSLKRKTFWSKRIVKKAAAHIRAFASETMDAMYVLKLFCDARGIATWPSMQEHVRALELMYAIARITCRPRDIMINLDAWEAFEAEYQEIHQRLYGTKPKCHIGRHAVDSCRDHQVYMSCWAPERDHHRSKMIANNCYNNLCKTLLDRCNHHFNRDLLNDKMMFRETHLVNADRCRSFEQQLGSICVMVASEAKCAIGTLRRGDFVYVVPMHATETTLVKVDMFLEICFPTRSSFLLVCEALVRVAASLWMPTNQHCVAPLEQAAQRTVVHIDADTGAIRGLM